MQEACWFNLKWKIPCILCFAAEEGPKSLRDLEYLNPITVDIFAEDKNVVQRVKRTTFTPLGPEELPKKGDLVAIDAEFVTLNQEEAELRSDGKVSTVKAAHMSVARITCVRGEGGMEGVPFIDDYISTQEQVGCRGN
jgi:PAB-dependent poly(A)-specific ribonuclease subunit 2